VKRAFQTASLSALAAALGFYLWQNGFAANGGSIALPKALWLGMTVLYWLILPPLGFSSSPAFRSQTLRQGRSLAYSGSLLSVYPTIHLRSLAWLSLRVRGIAELSTRTADLPNAKATSHLNTWGTDVDLSILPIEDLELFYRLDLRSLPAESGPRTTRCFMDTGLRCHPARRVELELTVQNLTNADRYTEIQYVDADRFATTFHLRPLHALLTLKAAF